MKRDLFLNKIQDKNFECDILVIGGGATGLGIAVDAASRGLKVVLLEQNDFAKSTSSRSTKLVHGGVRYLGSGDIKIVIQALQERGRMKENAPHLVKNMRFIIGNYRWWEQIYYTIGLSIYDLLSGILSFGRSKPLNINKITSEIPGLQQKGLRGGVVYHDGQFDDARMAISLMLTALDHGGICINYVKVEGLIKNNYGNICMVNATDQLSGSSFSVKTKSVINATGVFADKVLAMDNPEAKPIVCPSRGVHLVVDQKFLGGNSAIMIPKTKDGRVLFAVPWHNKVVIGTTDTQIKPPPSLEAKASEEEINFILDQAGQYLKLKPQRSDVLSVFAGLRPLAAPKNETDLKTKELSRGHKIYKSNSGLLTITGGKWTTYREMSQDAVDEISKMMKLNASKCITKTLKIHGYSNPSDDLNWNYVYGSDIDSINQIINENPKYAELLDKRYTFTCAHVVWAVRAEFAQTLEDVLARRVRALFLDAKASIAMAPKVASIMAQEMNKNKEWEIAQIKEYSEIAKGYILD